MGNLNKQCWEGIKTHAISFVALYLCIKIIGNFLINEVYTPIEAQDMWNLKNFYFVVILHTYFHLAVFPCSEMSLHVYKMYNTWTCFNFIHTKAKKIDLMHYKCWSLNNFDSFFIKLQKNVIFCDCTNPSVNSRAEALLTWFFSNTFGSFSLSTLTCPNALLKMLFRISLPELTFNIKPLCDVFTIKHRSYCSTQREEKDAPVFVLQMAVK